jgi:hypothetical protein
MRQLPLAAAFRELTALLHMADKLPALLPFANRPIQVILQATIAADYQGRVFTLMGSLAGAAAPFGLLLAAPIAEMVGVRSWYVTGGLVCLSMGIAGFFVPSLMRIEEPPEGATEEAASLTW